MQVDRDELIAERLADWYEECREDGTLPLVLVALQAGGLKEKLAVYCADETLGLARLRGMLIRAAGELSEQRFAEQEG